MHLHSGFLLLILSALPLRAAEAPLLQTHVPAGPAPSANLAGKPWIVQGPDIELRWIPPGTFVMSDPSVDATVQVHLTRGFWLGKYEITQKEWLAVTGNHPSYQKKVGLQAPVEDLSGEDATAFCKRVNQQQREKGALPEGYEYRLPTEAEWEYAGRAGTTGPYAGTGVLTDMGWYLSQADGQTHPVGQKRPNAWGLYDRHGNVWAWCSDWVGPYAGPEGTDPAGPTTGTYRADRGGSYFHDASNCESGDRGKRVPYARNDCLGLRLALAPKLAASTPAAP